MTTTRRPPHPGHRSRSRLVSRAPWLFGVAGAVLLPWIVLLACTLPSSTVAAHWRAAWAGLDGAEAVGLLATAFLARRRDPRVPLVAMATATLLTVDAWFDVLTAAPADLALALAQALTLELPLAALSATFAYRRLTHHATGKPLLEPPVTWHDITSAATPHEEIAPAVAA